MGEVYKARHTRLDRAVAIKVLPKDIAANPPALARFDREMKAISRLNHSHIVQAYDARDIDGATLLVMGYVDGMNLAQVLVLSGDWR